MNLPKPGDTFSQRYRIDGVLGEGGFAVVFDAIDVQTGQRVALKVLKAPDNESYSYDTRARFQREMGVLTQLQHPNIVDELAWGESADGLLYVAFEHLPGVDLSGLLNELGRMDPRDVVGILRQLLLALDAAHRVGLLHRDIKPQNVRVVDKTPGALRVKLLDFGIARSHDGSHPSITRTGDLVGTPRYMSPEQLRDQPLGPSSDLYSLGLMAFELLMGKSALAGNSLLDQMDRMLSDQVLSVPELERANPALLAVIQRMTEKDPARRFARAADVIARLDEIQTAQAAPLPSATDLTFDPNMDHSIGNELPFAPGLAPQTAPPVPPTPGRKPPVLAVAGVVAFVLAVVALALSWQQAAAPDGAVNRSPGQRPIGITKSKTPDPAPKTQVAATPEATPEPDLGPPERPLPAYIPAPSPGCDRAIPYEKVRLPRMHVYAPLAYKPTLPRPLVILIHDTSGLEGAAPRARDFFERSGFIDEAEQHNFVIIAPPDAFEGWQDPDQTVEFLRATVETTANELCIDEDRVFIVSHGKGARLTASASCEPWVTGIAINSFGLRSKDLVDRWCPEPAPAIWLTPQRSPQIPPDDRPACDGDQYLPLREIETMWGARNDCKGTPTETAHGKSLCRRWTCTTPFTSCQLDGGYPWPGVRPTLGDGRCGDTIAPDFPTAETIWKFFETVPSLENTD